MSKAFKSRNFSISASTVSSAGCPSIIDLDSAFTHVCGWDIPYCGSGSPFEIRNASQRRADIIEPLKCAVSLDLYAQVGNSRIPSTDITNSVCLGQRFQSMERTTKHQRLRKTEHSIKQLERLDLKRRLGGGSVEKTALLQAGGDLSAHFRFWS